MPGLPLQMLQQPQGVLGIGCASCRACILESCIRHSCLINMWVDRQTQHARPAFLTSAAAMGCACGQLSVMHCLGVLTCIATTQRDPNWAILAP